MPIYKVPGVTEGLKFTGQVLADIFLGKITQWNDPAITKFNAGVTLPATDDHRGPPVGGIRHDLHLGRISSGKVSPEFGKTVGVAASLNWPVGVGAKGNEGVSSMVNQTPGALGYVELVYAVQNKIRSATCKTVGELHSMHSRSDAVRRQRSSGPADACRLPRVDHESRRATNAYPIASFTWLLFYENPHDKDQSRRSWWIS